jgi:hypothetical protein
MAETVRLAGESANPLQGRRRRGLFEVVDDLLQVIPFPWFPLAQRASMGSIMKAVAGRVPVPEAVGLRPIVDAGGDRARALLLTGTHVIPAGAVVGTDTAISGGRLWIAATTSRVRSMAGSGSTRLASQAVGSGVLRSNDLTGLPVHRVYAKCPNHGTSTTASTRRTHHRRR